MLPLSGYREVRRGSQCESPLGGMATAGADPCDGRVRDSRGLTSSNHLGDIIFPVPTPLSRGHALLAFTIHVKPLQFCKHAAK
jgi:hypothetical protein